jgi:hypothetical protein
MIINIVNKQTVNMVKHLCTGIGMKQSINSNNQINQINFKINHRISNCRSNNHRKIKALDLPITKAEDILAIVVDISTDADDPEIDFHAVIDQIDLKTEILIRKTEEILEIIILIKTTRDITAQIITIMFIPMNP